MAGLIFATSFFKDSGIPKLMDDHLGSRVKYRGFDYSEILMNHLAIFLHGGDCTEDIEEHLGEHLKKVRGLSVCSADTILRGIKELVTPTEEMTSSGGITHQFNINLGLNQLLLKALSKTNQLNTKQEYTLVSP